MSWCLGGRKDGWMGGLVDRWMGWWMGGWVGGWEGRWVNGIEGSSIWVLTTMEQFRQVKFGGYHLRRWEVR